MVTVEGVTRTCWDSWHDTSPEPPDDFKYQPIPIAVSTSDGREWTRIGKHLVEV